jgi:hypothetical protein
MAIAQCRGTVVDPHRDEPGRQSSRLSRLRSRPGHRKPGLVRTAAEVLDERSAGPRFRWIPDMRGMSLPGQFHLRGSSAVDRPAEELESLASVAESRSRGSKGAAHGEGSTLSRSISATLQIKVRRWGGDAGRTPPSANQEPTVGDLLPRNWPVSTLDAHERGRATRKSALCTIDPEAASRRLRQPELMRGRRAPFAQEAMFIPNATRRAGHGSGCMTFIADDLAARNTGQGAGSALPGRLPRTDIPFPM